MGHQKVSINLDHFILNLEEISGLIHEFKVRNVAELYTATNLLGNIKLIFNELETNRKRIVSPIKKMTAEIDAAVRPLKIKLDDLKKKLETQMLDFISENNINIPRIEGAIASVILKDDYSIEIEDIEKIPVEYLLINEKKIREDIGNGVISINGINIKYHKKISMRLNKKE